VPQYGAEWSDGVKLGPIGSDLVPMGSDWVISHTPIAPLPYTAEDRCIVKIGETWHAMKTTL